MTGLRWWRLLCRRTWRLSPRPGRPTLDQRAGVIEIDLPEGVRVRVDAFVNERALSRVLRVLKGQL